MFFIEFLTDPGDTVLDIFAGSNTTGSAAEKLDRRWLAFEKDLTYLAASTFRFVDELPTKQLDALWSGLHLESLPVEVNRRKRELLLMEKPTANPRNQKGSECAPFEINRELLAERSFAQPSSSVGSGYGSARWLRPFFVKWEQAS